MRAHFSDSRGLSLIELLVMIVVVGVLLAVAMQSMTSSMEDMRRVATEREMEALAQAMVGNPSLASGGTRSDFGYVGDIGALPPNLQALRTNPGGWATWDGPYLSPGFAQDTTGYRADEWGEAYGYAGGVTITSTGGGTTLTKQFADSPDDYLNNTYRGVVRDAADSVPGAVYRDSVAVVITVPNGAGGLSTSSRIPDADGSFSIAGVPAGMHPVRVIYLPEVDTLFRYVTILPRHRNDPIDIYRFAEEYFGGGGAPGYTPGLTLVSGSVRVSGGTCDKITFQVANNSGAPITVSSVTLTWASPTAYYEEVTFGGQQVVKKNSGLPGSGSVATFSSAKTVAHGATATVVVEKFRQSSGGGGPRVSMANVSLTVQLSDGSTISFNTGAC